MEQVEDVDVGADEAQEMEKAESKVAEVAEEEYRWA